jgi:hypothetical protein
MRGMAVSIMHAQVRMARLRFRRALEPPAVFGGLKSVVLSDGGWRCSRARAPFQARHYLFAFPSSQQGRSFYQSARSIGLVGFAVPLIPIRAPLDRFRVGLMAEIPARENFKNTKPSKTFQIPLGPREKLLGRAGLVF